MNTTVCPARALSFLCTLLTAALRCCRAGLECKSFVGLLPVRDLPCAVAPRFLTLCLQEINRAYITVDNKLYLWNYQDGCVCKCHLLIHAR